MLQDVTFNQKKHTWILRITIGLQIHGVSKKSKITSLGTTVFSLRPNYPSGLRALHGTKCPI